LGEGGGSFFAGFRVWADELRAIDGGASFLGSTFLRTGTLRILAISDTSSISGFRFTGLYGGSFCGVASGTGFLTIFFFLSARGLLD